MKKEPFQPNAYYLIKNVGNNQEYLFYEEKNRRHFLLLFERHVGQIAELSAYCIFQHRFELLVKIKPEIEIPDKFKEKMYLPLSHFFNAYTKSFNKMYGRSGSLFREHFFRKRISGGRSAKVEKRMRILNSAVQFETRHPSSEM